MKNLHHPMVSSPHNLICEIHSNWSPKMLYFISWFDWVEGCLWLSRKRWDGIKRKAGIPTNQWSLLIALTSHFHVLLMRASEVRFIGTLSAVSRCFTYSVDRKDIQFWNGNWRASNRGSNFAELHALILCYLNEFQVKLGWNMCVYICTCIH